MNRSIRKTIAYTLAAGIVGLSVFSFGQAKENDREILEGKWVLETATVQKITDGDTLTVDVNTLKNNQFIALYDTLLFQADTLAIPLNDIYFKGEYNRTENRIEFHFLPVTVVLYYTLKEEKIYFTQQTTFGCEDCIYSVQTIYKQGSHEDNE